MTRAASGRWRGNLARQAIWLTVPFGVQQLIRLAGLLVLLVAEVERWLVPAAALRSEKFTLFGHDVVLMLLVGAGALALKTTASTLSLAPTIAQQWLLGAVFNG